MSEKWKMHATKSFLFATYTTLVFLKMNVLVGVDDDDSMFLKNESVDEEPITSNGSSSVDTELKRRRIASSL